MQPAGLHLEEQPSDEVLMERYRSSQDSHALSELVTRYWPQAYKFSYRYLGDPAGAEDAAQETFVRLVGYAPRHERVQSFRPWFYQILVNALRNQVRETTRRANREAARSLASVGNGVDHQDPADRLFAREVVERLRELPEQLRATLTLKYFEGHTEREIAEITQCSVGTVASRVRHGLERLRQTLGVAGRAVPVSGIVLALSQGTAEAAPVVPPAPSVAVLMRQGVALAKKGIVTKLVAAVLAVGLLVPAAWVSIQLARQKTDAGSLANAQEATVAEASSPIARPGLPGDADRGVPETPVGMGQDGASGAPSASAAAPEETAEPKTAVAKLTGVLLRGRLHWLEPDRAVPGATIKVFDEQADEDDEGVSAETELDGTFELAVRGPGSFGLVIDSESWPHAGFAATVNGNAHKSNGTYLDFEIPDGTSQMDLDLWFDAEAGVTGHVMDVETQLPIPDAQILCKGQEAVTAKDGSFRLGPFAAVLPVELSIEVNEEKYAEALYELSVTSENPFPSVDIYLEPGIEIHGTVTDSFGKPIAGAAVTIEGRMPYQSLREQKPEERDIEVFDTGHDFGQTSQDWETATGTDGSYRFERIPSEAVGPSGSSGKSDSLDITVTCPGYATGKRDDVTIRRSRENVFDFALELAAGLEVRVQEENGSPVPGAWVSVLEADDARNGRFSLLLQEGADVVQLTDNFLGSATRTSQEGMVVLKDLPPGTHQLFVGAEGFENRSVNVETTGSTTQTLVVLREQSMILGKVTDEDGLPLGDVFVKAFAEKSLEEALQREFDGIAGEILESLQEDTRWLSWIMHGSFAPIALSADVTDATGNFRLRGLSTGRYDLVAVIQFIDGPDNDTNAAFSVPAGSNAVHLVIERKRRPSVLFVPSILGSEDAVESVSYQVNRIENGEQDEYASEGQPVEDGRILFGVSEPGLYRVSAQITGTLPLDLGTHFLAQGQQLDLGTVYFVRGGGHVEGSLKLPADGKDYDVAISTTDPETGFERTVYIEAGESLSFQIPWLRPGRQTFTVELYPPLGSKDEPQPYPFETTIIDGTTTTVQWELPPP